MGKFWTEARDRMKVCSSCEKAKVRSAFHKNRTTKDGLQAWCRRCVSEYGRSYRSRGGGSSLGPGVREILSEVRRRTGKRVPYYQTLYRASGRESLGLGSGSKKPYTHGEIEAAIFWIRAMDILSHVKVSGRIRDARDRVSETCRPGWVIFDSDGFRFAETLRVEDLYPGAVAIPAHDECGETRDVAEAGSALFGEVRGTDRGGSSRDLVGVG